MKIKKLLAKFSIIRSLIKKISERLKKTKSIIKSVIMRSFPVRSLNNISFFITVNPILSTIGVSAIFYTIIMGIVWVFGGVISMMWLSIITIIYFGSVYWLAHFVKKFAKKFTVVELKKDQIALVYFGEEPKIYHGPLSGEKPTSTSVIQLPENWGTEITKYDLKELEIEVTISLDKRLLNSIVIIHFFIEFEFLGPFRAVDLEHVITKGDIDSKSPFAFKSFIKEVLMNGDSKFEEIKMNVERHKEGNLMMPKLIDEILLDTKFPKHLFPNILGTWLRIGIIEFQSKKQM